MYDIKTKEKLIIALDVDSLKSAEKIIKELDDYVVTYKVGLQLFIKEGYDVIRMLKKYEKNVFLDLKFHDIPNTVVNAVKSAFEHDVDMLTIHSTGGFDMMESIAKLLWQWKNGGKKTPLVFAVTLLTSLDSAFLEDLIGTTNRTIEEEVVILANAAKSAGIMGVVSSPKEIKMIRKECGDEILILTPGIRPKGFSADDQARTATPFDAIKDGADYIVVGRPVIANKNKRKVVELILEEISEALSE